MKKTIVNLIFVCITSIGFSQSIFDSLENLDDVRTVVVNKDAFEILSKFKVKENDNEAIEVFKMVQDLQELKVFTTENTSIANKMESMVQTVISKEKLTELMRVKDKDARVKIYVKSNKNKDFVREVLMFVKNRKGKTNKSESVIVSLVGNIDINKMSKLADTFSKKSK